MTTLVKSGPVARTEAGVAGRTRLAPLVAGGAALQALLLALTLLYVNVPAGYNALAGLSLGSVALFRAVWPYPRLPIAPEAFGWLAAGLILALWAAYFAGVRAVPRGLETPASRGAGWTIAAFALLFNAALVALMPPVLSGDLYQYILHGRMATAHGLNPHALPAGAIAADPAYAYLIDRGFPSHYGPVWTLVEVATAAVTGDSLLGAVIAFKAVAALANLVNALLVWLLARRLTGGDGLRPLVLYAWNPLILIEAAGGGHNDLAMLTFALLGVYLAARGHRLLGAALLAVSVLVKWVTGLLLLFYALSWLGQATTWRERAGRATLIAAVSLAVAAVCYLPFWSGPATFSGLVFHASEAESKSIVRGLTREVVASRLVDGTTTPEAARRIVEPYVSRGFTLAFALLVLGLARSALRRGTSLPRSLELWGIAGVIYVMLVYSWSFPWYLIPMLGTIYSCPPSRTNHRLIGWAVASGIALMLLMYAVVVPDPPAVTPEPSAPPAERIALAHVSQPD